MPSRTAPSGRYEEAKVACQAVEKVRRCLRSNLPFRYPLVHQANDTVNYMAEGTKDAVKTVARSIKEGVQEAQEKKSS